MTEGRAQVKVTKHTILLIPPVCTFPLPSKVACRRVLFCQQTFPFSSQEHSLSYLNHLALYCVLLSLYSVSLKCGCFSHNANPRPPVWQQNATVPLSLAKCTKDTIDSPLDILLVKDPHKQYKHK